MQASAFSMVRECISRASDDRCAFLHQRRATTTLEESDCCSRHWRSSRPVAAGEAGQAAVLRPRPRWIHARRPPQRSSAVKARPSSPVRPPPRVRSARCRPPRRLAPCGTQSASADSRSQEHPIIDQVRMEWHRIIQDTIPLLFATHDATQDGISCPFQFV